MTKRKAKPEGFPDLRKLAKHKPCMLRIPDICNGDPKTTVGAHIRRANIAGMSEKPTDLAIVWACSACAWITDNTDHRPVYMSRDQLERLILDGLCRTLEQVGKAIGV